MTKIKKVKKVVEKTGKFSFELSVNDIIFKTEAEDIRSALTEFVKSPLYPVGVKTRVFIKYGTEDKEATHTIPVVIARRLFSILAFKESALEILAKKLSDKLNG